MSITLKGILTIRWRSSRTQADVGYYVPNVDNNDNDDGGLALALMKGEDDPVCTRCAKVTAMDDTMVWRRRTKGVGRPSLPTQRTQSEDNKIRLQIRKK